jgi:1,2-diacylglycerol 3-alpha-glucosyltransferase
MNIAFFSECWDPQINGVVTSTKALTSTLRPPEDTISIFAPRYPGFIDKYPHIFRQPAIRYFFQPEFYFSNPLPYRAIRQAREWKIDLVHMHTEFMLGMVAGRIARALDIPCVLTLHTLWEFYSHYFLYDLLPRNLFRFFLSLLYRACDYFIAPSQKAKDYLEGVMRIKKPIAIIPTGINLDMFNNAVLTPEERNRLRALWGVGPKDILLIFVGRVGKEKSLDVLINGISVLSQKNPAIKLLIVGGGPHLEHLKRLVALRKLSSAIIFTGYIPYDRMPSVYRMADIFTIASVSETQGLVTVEALASGLPVIVKNDPASVEIVSNGRHGLIFHKDEDFPKTVLGLLSNPTLMEKLQNTAQAAAERYNDRHYGKSVREYYEWILSDFKNLKDFKNPRDCRKKHS